MQILYTAADIAGRVSGMGREISGFFRGKPLTLVALMNGALPFAADLMRAIDLPLQCDSIGVASYRQRRSTGELAFRSELKLAPEGRYILLADEVLDSGITLREVRRYFLDRGAAGVYTAVMIEKERPRPDGITSADWYGFRTPDRYLVGYGLDADEEYRNLPYIAALD